MRPGAGARCCPLATHPRAARCSGVGPPRFGGISPIGSNLQYPALLTLLHRTLALASPVLRRGSALLEVGSPPRARAPAQPTQRGFAPAAVVPHNPCASANRRPGLGADSLPPCHRAPAHLRRRDRSKGNGLPFAPRRSRATRCLRLGELTEVRPRGSAVAWSARPRKRRSVGERPSIRRGCATGAAPST